MESFYFDVSLLAKTDTAGSSLLATNSGGVLRSDGFMANERNAWHTTSCGARRIMTMGRITTSAPSFMDSDFCCSFSVGGFLVIISRQQIVH